MTTLRLARVATIAALLAGTVAAGRERHGSAAAPEREHLIAEMLGSRTALPGACQLEQHRVDGTAIHARYACGNDPLELKLTYRAVPPGSAIQIPNFAITVLKGRAPPGFLSALAAHVRSRADATRPMGGTRRIVLLVTLMLLMAGGFAFYRLQSSWRSGRTQRPLMRRPHRSGRDRTVAVVRIVGLLAIAVITAWNALASDPVFGEPAALPLAVFVLAGFLWLVASGFFGYGSPRRGDWVALVPFGIALLVRELLVVHSVQEIEIQFAQGPIGRHSIVYPLLQLSFAPLLRDPHAFTMHMNGILGAIATLSLYLFVRHRTESRGAAFLCSLFLAIHPVVARFSPTDGPYAFLLATWFSGLALLSAPALDARGLFAGAALVGLAASTRIEGVVILVASLLLLDTARVMAAGYRHPRAACLAAIVVATQIAAQLYLLLPFHLAMPAGATASPLGLIVRDAVWPFYDDWILRGLIWMGAIVGVLSRRLRLGLSAMIATAVLAVPAVHAGDWIVALHRMVPTCAVQMIGAGIGAYGVAAWFPWRRQRRWLLVVPGILAACYVSARHAGELSTAYVFTDEYDLVRHHLGPSGAAPDDCELMTLNSLVHSDLDLHDFNQVVPMRTVIDCGVVNCPDEVTSGGCFYYVRSAACYFHEHGVSAPCAGADGGATQDRRMCLNEATASFEDSVRLEPVEIRTIDLDRTFPHAGFPAKGYPPKAEVGLFRVHPKLAVDQ